MRPITEADLIGADAGILDFIRQADFSKFRFLVTGTEISGLVSLSDLQRLPVRAALFGVITHLEMVMTEVIRVKYRSFTE
ncbi:MAG: hypothetical protein JZU55_04890, partial [Afipia sp.]|nr:hypothetical protein [Afipia sp.]